MKLNKYLSKLNINIELSHNQYLLKSKDSNHLFYLSCPLNKNNSFYDISGNNFKYKGTNCLFRQNNNIFEFFKDGNQLIKITFIENSAVEYFPSENGILAKVKSSAIKGKIIYSKDSYFRCNNRYLAIYNRDYLPTLLISPLYGILNNNYCLAYINYQEIKEDEIDFEICCEEESSEVHFEIYGYTPKSIFDTLVEPYHKDRNNVYSPTCFMDGANQEELLIRFNYENLEGIINTSIKKSYLYLKTIKLSKTVSIEKYEIKTVWCSFGTTFNNQPVIKLDTKEQVEIFDDFIRIDVTKNIQSFTSLSDVNEQGFLLKIKQGSIIVITADSYYYPAMIEIIK